MKEETAARERPVGTMEWSPQYPSAYFHQEVARARHADRLREARQHQLASLLRAEREREPHVRVARLVQLGLLASLLRGKVHTARPADSAC